MKPQFYALLAALFFGLGTPFSKMLLLHLTPLQISGLVNIGGGIGIVCASLLLSFTKKEIARKIAIPRTDWVLLAFAALSGALAAPVLLLFGLKSTSAATASILLTFESVATAVLAWLFFRERVTGKVWLAVVVITISAIVLSFDASGNWGISPGAVLIALACIMWGLDNNISSRIKGLPIFVIVMVKSGVAGVLTLALSLLIGEHLPEPMIIVQALLLGFVSCGISLTCFMISLRQIGASQTSSMFGTAPFFGAIASLLLFWQLPSIQMLCSLPFLIFGVVLLLKQRHTHVVGH